MVMPKFQSIFSPLLNFVSDKKEYSVRETIEELSKEFKLTKKDKNQVTLSGTPLFYDRVTWAITYLKKAGLLVSNRKGYFQITESGLEVLSQNPSKIDTNFLLQYAPFAEFRKRPLKPKSDN